MSHQERWELRQELLLTGGLSLDLSGCSLQNVNEGTVASVVADFHLKKNVSLRSACDECGVQNAAASSVGFSISYGLPVCCNL